MAYRNITYENMQTFASELKAKYATKEALNLVAADATAAIKAVDITGHTVKFYTKADKAGAAVAQFNFPTEMFLDQTKTTFVESFAWTEEAYPGSEDPELEGKPVMVLAVRGDADGDNNAANDTVTYSFLNMTKLVDTYKAKTTGKDASTTITISGYEVEVKVNLSEEDDNLIEAKNDGLYVGHDSTKVDKVTSAVANHLATFVSGGNIQDSGKTIGGAELDETPDANTLATEAAVADQISNVVKYTDLKEVTEAEMLALLADEPTGGEPNGE